MPIFIPPYMGEEIKSNAEKKMFEILQDLNLKKGDFGRNDGITGIWYRSGMYYWDCLFKVWKREW